MASLKFIMDMDDEEPAPSSSSHMNKKESSASSVPESGRDDTTAPSRVHSGGSTERLSPAPSTKRRGAPGRHSRSPAAVLSPPPPPSSTTTTSGSRQPPPPPAGSRVRQPNIVSTDEMDRYGPPVASSSSTPMRPMGTPSSGEAPVKLTPITGRTFTRAEHLRRHQLSHQTPGYPCTYPGCDKAFHRQDLLARHMTRHEQEGDRASSRRASVDSSRRTSATSADDSASRAGYLPPTTSNVSARSLSRGSLSTSSAEMPSGSGYAMSHHTYQNMNSHSSTASRSGAPMSPPQMPGASRQESGSSGGYILSSQPQIPVINNQPPSVEGSPASGGGYGLDYQPRTASPYPVFGMQSHLPSLIIPEESATPGLMAHHDASPYLSSDSNFSTPSDGSQRAARWNPRYASPAPDWPLPGPLAQYPAASSQGLSSPGGGLDALTATAPFFVNPFSHSSSHHQSFTEVMDMPLFPSDEHGLLAPGHHPLPFSSVRSPSPSTVSSSVQSAESLVTPAPTISGLPGMVAGRYKEPAALLGSLSGVAFLTALTLPRPVRNAIPALLQVFWNRCDPAFPIIHRRSFDIAPNEILRCAMAAMATQYLDGKDDRVKGSQLHEFAWQEAKRAVVWDAQIMQAIILCEYFARFRGRRAVVRSSEQFRSLYSRVCHGVTYNSDTMGAVTDEQLWIQWAEAESKRRLLASCFVLDVHASAYHEQPLTEAFSSAYPPIPLTRCSEDLWAAPTWERWKAIMTAHPGAEPLVLNEDAITAESVASAPALDRAVFMASEVLRLPRRTSPSALDVSLAVDLSITDRITTFCPDSPVANTYLALHFTPLHDLLAVSGDSWVFTHKVMSNGDFQQQQKRLKAWSNSLHAATGAKFAAQALLGFLDNSNTTSRGTVPMTSHENFALRWKPTDITGYWAIHVCALILWALGHQANRGAGTGVGTGASVGASAGNVNGHSARDGTGTGTGAGTAEEAEAVSWLRMVATLQVDEILQAHVRGRPEIGTVVAFVRRKLDDEARGGKSRLLVDCLGVMKKLEKGANWKWF